MRPDLRKLKALTDMQPPKFNNELWVFLGVLTYLSKFFAVTAEVCEPK